MFWEISVFFQQIFIKWPYKQNPWKIQDNQYIIGLKSVCHILSKDSPLEVIWIY